MKYFIYIFFAAVYNYNDVRFVLATTRIVPHILEFSSCLHVTLLIFLRLLAIRYPLSYQILHKKLRHISIIAIWAITSLVQSIPLFTLLFAESKRLYTYVRLVLLNCFGTIPVVSMVIMSILFAWTVNKRKHLIPNTDLNTASKFNDAITRKLNSRVQKVVTRFFWLVIRRM